MLCKATQWITNNLLVIVQIAPMLGITQGVTIQFDYITFRKSRICHI
jgi:hypothetical protein